ncbi:Cir1 protein [Saccharomycopsis crataegensis]|uniref:Probable electron transfer flavoprotein subunit beta n=1 Tax=Saccharomycopsis crataegensis TaxID=43959 RepID=A0AAV5QRD1_9ASCO|nr:Cir1 protein [Saccharomycopsis crataegensis]
MSSKLRILVPVKRTIDAAIKPRINKANTGIESSGVKFSINPFDDIAIEEALKLKEKNKGLVENIHAVTVGPKKSEEILKNCLAKGVDKTTLVSIDDKKPELQPLSIAKILSKLVEENNSNLVIMGKQAIDNDCNQTGQLLAGLLNWSQASNASQVIVDEANGEVTVHQEVDGGSNIVKSKLPLVVTTDLRLNTPRYVSLPKLMKAKKKPSNIVKLDQLGLAELQNDNRIEILKVSEPPARPSGKILGSVDELIGELKNKKLL